MRIQFIGKDPRAGTIAQMDSHRGQQLIDSGAAVLIGENDVIVTVIKNFEKNTRGQTINVTRAEADRLEREGLISRHGLHDSPPGKASGEELSSASLVAPVAPQKTSKKSGGGAKKQTAKTAE